MSCCTPHILMRTMLWPVLFSELRLLPSAAYLKHSPRRPVFSGLPRLSEQHCHLESGPRENPRRHFMLSTFSGHTGLQNLLLCFLQAHTSNIFMYLSFFWGCVLLGLPRILHQKLHVFSFLFLLLSHPHSFSIRPLV